MHNPGKFLLILSYLFLGAYLALFFPWRTFTKLFQVKNDTPNQPLNSYTAPKHYPYFIAIFIGLSVCALAPWIYVLACLLVCVLLYYSRAQADKKNAALIFIGLMFSSFLPVWLHNEKNRLELSIWQIAIFLGITIAVYLLWNVANTFKKSDRSKYQTNLVNAVFIALLLVVYSMSITVGISTPDFAQWHHWGAYIGPAQMVYSGAYPLYDIPMQYGLGPTLAIASGCKWGCWSALFWVVSISNILFILVLSKIALKLYKPVNWLGQSLILLTILVFFVTWGSNLYSLQAPNAFPSGNSLRFFPGLLMLYLLVNKTSAKPNADKKLFLTFENLSIFIIWILSFLWSPEAGIHTSCLIAPYFFWESIALATPGNKLRQGLITLVRLLLVFISGLALSLGAYFLIYQCLPKLSLYLVYITHPINPSPVNQNGPIWVIGITSAMMIGWLKSHNLAFNDQIMLRRAWVVALLCFANFSYCLGRSADGNLIAMLPYFMLLLLIMQRWSPSGLYKSISTVFLASIIGWGILPLHVSNYQRAFQNDHLFSLDSSRITKAFSRSNPDSQFFIKIDNAQEVEKAKIVPEALAFITSKYDESVETLDRYNLIDASDLHPPWNALYGPANFAELPSDVRQEYLRAIKNRFNRAGWLLFDKDYKKEMSGYLIDFDTVYDRDITLDFGPYQAIRYTPKN